MATNAKGQISPIFVEVFMTNRCFGSKKAKRRILRAIRHSRFLNILFKKYLVEGQRTFYHLFLVGEGKFLFDFLAFADDRDFVGTAPKSAQIEFHAGFHPLFADTLAGNLIAVGVGYHNSRIVRGVLLDVDVQAAVNVLVDDRPEGDGLFGVVAGSGEDYGSAECQGTDQGFD